MRTGFFRSLCQAGAALALVLCLQGCQQRPAKLVDLELGMSYQQALTVLPNLSPLSSGRAHATLPPNDEEERVFTQYGRAGIRAKGAVLQFESDKLVRIELTTVFAWGSALTAKPVLDSARKQFGKWDKLESSTWTGSTLARWQYPGSKRLDLDIRTGSAGYAIIGYILAVSH